MVKAGEIRLAQVKGIFVIPIYATADRAWYFKSWDRFMLPKPFERVNLSYGEMLDLTLKAGEEDFERQRARLLEIMLPCLHTF